MQEAAVLLLDGHAKVVPRTERELLLEMRQAQLHGQARLLNVREGVPRHLQGGEASQGDTTYACCSETPRTG